MPQFSGLIKCPKCGVMLSDKAETCPECGYPLKPETLRTAVGHSRCPKCGKLTVHGGMSWWKWLVAVFLSPVLIGILLWAVWRKKTCYNCGLQFA